MTSLPPRVPRWPPADLARTRVTRRAGYWCEPHVHGSEAWTHKLTRTVRNTTLLLRLPHASVRVLGAVDMAGLRARGHRRQSQQRNRWSAGNERVYGSEQP